MPGSPTTPDVRLTVRHGGDGPESEIALATRSENHEAIKLQVALLIRVSERLNQPLIVCSGR
jgi:hypothetical protein